MSFFQRSPFHYIFILSLLFQLVCSISNVPMLSTLKQVRVEDKTNQTARIIGGFSADEFVAKRLADIRLTLRNNSGEETPSCSGSVLNRRWLLTAAHCFFGEESNPSLLISVNETFAFIGEADARFELDDPDVEPFWFESVFVHNEFESSSINTANDIAIVRLNRPIPGNKFAPVTLSRFSNRGDFRKRLVSAAGFGDIDNMETLPEVLMETELMTKDFRVCEEFEDEEAFSFLEDDKVICATALEFPNNATTDTCSGDSGGPLFIGDSETDSFIQIGVTSFGPSVCAEPGSVSWYTRTSYYYDQIQDALDGNFDAWIIFE